MRVFDENLAEVFEKYRFSDNVFLCVCGERHYMVITDERGLSGKRYIMPCRSADDVIYACETAALAAALGYDKIKPYMGGKTLAELMQ